MSLFEKLIKPSGLAGGLAVCLFSASTGFGQDYYEAPVVQATLTDQPATTVVEPAPEAIQEPVMAAAPVATESAPMVAYEDCGCEAAPVVTEAACGCGEKKCGGRLCGRLKGKGDAKPSPCAGSHKGLFYANDFSYLNEDDYCGHCLGDNLKQLSVGRCGKLDIGGQIRYRYHSERGMGRQAGFSGFENTQNDFGLIRLRLYANYKVNNDIRLYAEGIYADVANADGLYLPRPIDRNRGDFLNLFADVALTEQTILRVGRQELLFGDQRFVSPLDWANTRRTFEGVRTITKTENMELNMFWTQFVPVAFDSFDNPDENQDFYGGYATFTGLENATVEGYVLGYNNDNVAAPVASNFDLVTFGSRMFGSTKNKMLWEVEGAAQTGVQNGLGVNHEAFAWTAGLGRQLGNLPWKPTVWAYYDFASGDNVGDPDFNRFNQLFPLAHKYLGFIDAVARSNISSPNVRMTMSPTQKLSLLLWYYNFQTDEANDIIPGVAVPSNQVAGETDFGNELDFLATYKVGPRTNVVAGYSHLWRGAKIIGDTDADFFYLQAQTDF